jgi:hypothetical protein
LNLGIFEGDRTSNRSEQKQEDNAQRAHAGQRSKHNVSRFDIDVVLALELDKYEQIPEEKTERKLF